MTATAKPPLTTAEFDLALHTFGSTPAKPDRDAAFAIASFLDGCCVLLRDAEKQRAASVTDAKG
jgi:hypothetical protein